MIEQLSAFATEDLPPPTMRCRAKISLCGHYRYSLLREWDPEGRRLLWVMLNPSSADHEINDPTTIRCISFGRRWGFGSIEVVNLFAYRATRPSELVKAPCCTVGPENDRYTTLAAAGADEIIVAWGSSGIRKQPRVDYVLNTLLAGRELRCLGINADGTPKHPLYVSGTVTPVIFRNA